MLLKHRSNAVLIGIRDTSFWTLKCIEKNIPLFFKKRPMFFQKHQMFFSKQRYVFFDYLTYCK